MKRRYTRAVWTEYGLPLEPEENPPHWERAQERAENELFEEFVDTDEWCTADDAWQILPGDVPYDVAEWTAEAVNENLRDYRKQKAKEAAA